jgi:hypothetical protein
MPKRALDPQLARLAELVARRVLRAHSLNHVPTEREARYAIRLLQQVRPAKRGPRSLSEERLRDLMEYMEARCGEGMTIEQAAERAATLEGGYMPGTPKQLDNTLFEFRVSRGPLHSLEAETLVKLYRQHRKAFQHARKKQN